MAKRLLTILTAFWLCITAQAYDLKVDNIHFNLDQQAHTASVCGCSSRTEGITIPEVVQAGGRDYRVTAIADSAFYGNGYLSGVDIAQSILSIGRSAFRDCGRLTGIVIPASVTSIGEFAFRGCSALQGITVDEDNRHFSSYEGVLYDKRQTLLIQCPRTKSGEFRAPHSVREVAPYAFYKCSKIYTVYLYNNVEVIGEHAFDNASALEEIWLGNGLRYIGSFALDHIKPLRHIYLQAPTPPSAQEDTFDYSWIEFCKLHVPAKAVSTYRATRPWNWVEEVTAMPENLIEMGIEATNALTPPSQSFALDGRKWTQGMGVSIVKEKNGKTRKIRTKK